MQFYYHFENQLISGRFFVTMNEKNFRKSMYWKQSLSLLLTKIRFLSFLFELRNQRPYHIIFATVLQTYIFHQLKIRTPLSLLIPMMQLFFQAYLKLYFMT